MPLPLASYVSALIGVYVLIGIGVAVWSHAVGLDQDDPDVKAGSWGFRVLVTPGLVALWPLIVARLARTKAISPATYAAPHDPQGRALAHRIHARYVMVVALLLLALFLLAFPEASTTGFTGG